MAKLKSTTNGSHNALETTRAIMVALAENAPEKMWNMTEKAVAARGKSIGEPHNAILAEILEAEMG